MIHDNFRRFILERKQDLTGVSGEGIVACGVQFHNGKCALCWNTTPSSVAIYNNIDELEQIHGHNGATKVIFINDRNI